MFLFNNWVNECSLIEISNYELDNTWSISKSKSRLDRFFVSTTWVSDFRVPEEFYVPILAFNHFSIGNKGVCEKKSGQQVHI